MQIPHQGPGLGQRSWNLRAPGDGAEAAGLQTARLTALPAQSTGTAMSLGWSPQHPRPPPPSPSRSRSSG